MNSKIERIVNKTKSLKDFLKIWKHSYPAGAFKEGAFLYQALEDLETYKRIRILSSRQIGKSTRAYIRIVSKTLKSKWNSRVFYISSTPEQARHHTKEIKRLIESNDFLIQCLEDLNPKAEAELKYKNIYGYTTEIKPFGMTTSRRGWSLKDALVVFDDVFRENLSIMPDTNVELINDRFSRTWLPMIHSSTEVIILGTPFSTADFYYNESLLRGYFKKTEPALVGNESIFPEFRSTEWLLKRKSEMSEVAWKIEYMSQPIFTGDSFINPESLEKCIKPHLKNLNGYKGRYETIMCADIQKSRKSNHATHIAIFKIVGDILIQIYSGWLQGSSYISQMDHFKDLIQRFKVSRFYVDNTNSVLDVFFEDGSAPEEMQGIHITRPLKEKCAFALDKLITTGKIQLIDDRRQRDQLLLTQSNLKARTTKDGHSDSFTTLGFASHFYADEIRIFSIAI